MKLASGDSLIQEVLLQGCRHWISYEITITKLQNAHRNKNVFLLTISPIVCSLLIKEPIILVYTSAIPNETRHVLFPFLHQQNYLWSLTNNIHSLNSLYLDKYFQSLKEY